MATPLREFNFIKGTDSSKGFISFSRGSEASYYGSDGYLHFAEEGVNLLSNSLDFTDSAWSKVGTSVSVPGNILGLDGTATASKFSESSSKGEHRMSRTIDVEKGSPFTISIYVKAVTASRVHFCFMNGSTFTGGNPGIRFDLTTGKFISTSSNTVSYEAIASGDGWWRLKVTGIPDLGTSSGMHLYIIGSDNSFSYQGNTSKYLHVWGAQFEQGSNLSAYTLATVGQAAGLRYNYDLSGSTPKLIGALIEPAGTNLLPYSQLFTNDAWRKQYATVVSSNVKSPDGNTNAFKLKEDNNNTSHYITPNPTITSSARSTYTFSAFLKAAERKWAYFNLNGLTVHFDLVNGVVGNYNEVFTAIIVESAGNGWFRCSATFVVDVSTTSAKIGPEKSNGQTSYDGDGNSGILVWGVQFEKSDKMTSYIRTSAGKASRSGDVVSLTKPSGSSHDVFVQRADGGVWMNNMTTNYQVGASDSAVQVVNYYNADESISSKDQTAQSLFPQLYKTVGLSLTKVAIDGNTYVVQTPNKSYSLQQAYNKTAPIFRSEVRSGDTWSGDASSTKKKERSEFYMKDADLPYDQDIWLSYSIRISPGDKLNLTPSEFCYLGQFHANEDSADAVSPPILGFRFEGTDILRAYTASATDRYHKTSPTAVLRGTGTVPRGVWNKMVVRMRFSPTKGQLQWWLNGKQLINVSNIGMGYVDAYGPYWKFGIYRSAMPQTLVVEYANMEHKVGTSLISRVTTPILIA